MPAAHFTCHTRCRAAVTALPRLTNRVGPMLLRYHAYGGAQFSHVDEPEPPHTAMMRAAPPPPDVVLPTAMLIMLFATLNQRVRRWHDGGEPAASPLAVFVYA